MVLHEALLSIIVYKPFITFTIAMETSAYALEHDQEKDKQTMGRDRTAPEKSKAGVRFGTLLAFPFREGGEQAGEVAQDAPRHVRSSVAWNDGRPWDNCR